MDHYLDISIRPDPEFATALLMNALFNKLHRALVQISNKQIGISFPEVQLNRPYLGGRLRLHGDAMYLRTLMENNWLTGMRDHISVSDIRQIPDGVQYVSVRRVQVQSNPERLRRRYSQRHHVSETEALERLPDSVAQRINLPFVTVCSQSTDQKFRMFISHGPFANTPQPGEFNCYGLSQGATVPWF